MTARLIVAMALAAAAGFSPGFAAEGPVAPAPLLEYAFTATIEVGLPLEQGEVEGGRKRFIPISGGSVAGPMLNGRVMAGGGDWQVIEANGLTRVLARYFFESTDGTVIEVTNPGVRVAALAVIEKLARNEPVDPSEYYFRTAPVFAVPPGKHEWLRRHTFVARGVRRPDKVLIDYYVVR